jgi:rubredoxin
MTDQNDQANEDAPALIHTFYEDSACPDCGEPIPHSATEGEACEGCGHVFSAPHPDDDAEPSDEA